MNLDRPFLEETSGSQDLTSDYSSVNGKAILVPGGEKALTIYGMRVWVASASTDYDKLGGLTLTNGLQFLLEKQVDAQAAVPWKYLFNGQVFKTMQDFERVATLQVLNDNLSATRSSTFILNFYEPIRVIGRNSERLAVPLKDNYSTLAGFELWPIGQEDIYG